MVLKKNILAGKSKLILFLFSFIAFFFIVGTSISEDILEETFTDLKILDKISSKNTLVKLKNGELITFKDLSIKSLKCKNSEFDDNPEITAYIQVKDLTDENNNEVFVFNGWMFSSSPSVTPFDHPVYDVRLMDCYQITVSLSNQPTLKSELINFL